jgi:hypothetical protein
MAMRHSENVAAALEVFAGKELTCAADISV